MGGHVLAGDAGVLGFGGLDGPGGQFVGAADLPVTQPGGQTPPAGPADGDWGLVPGQEYQGADVAQVEFAFQAGKDLGEVAAEPVDGPGAVVAEVTAVAGEDLQLGHQLVAGPQRGEVSSDTRLQSRGRLGHGRHAPPFRCRSRSRHEASLLLDTASRKGKHGGWTRVMLQLLFRCPEVAVGRAAGRRGGDPAAQSGRLRPAEHRPGR